MSSQIKFFENETFEKYIARIESVKKEDMCRLPEKVQTKLATKVHENENDIVQQYFETDRRVVILTEIVSILIADSLNSNKLQAKMLQLENNIRKIDMNKTDIERIESLLQVIKQVSKKVENNGTYFCQDTTPLKFLELMRAELDEIEEEILKVEKDPNDIISKENLETELGDSLFNVLMLAQLCQIRYKKKSEMYPTLNGAAKSITEKIIRRCPYSFGAFPTPSPSREEERNCWIKAKNIEKSESMARKRKKQHNDETDVLTWVTKIAHPGIHLLPNWMSWLKSSSAYELVRLREWEDKNWRQKNGFKGHDLIHNPKSAVYISSYWWSEKEMKLIGCIHFKSLSESHATLCHGGSMTSAMDDILGWTSFLAGKGPWCGATAQINVSLKKPIKVGSTLVITAKVDERTPISGGRCKLRIKGTLKDETGLIYASLEGISIGGIDLLKNTKKHKYTEKNENNSSNNNSPNGSMAINSNRVWRHRKISIDGNQKNICYA